MKIKTEYYGVFYKNRDKWVGPFEDNIFTKQEWEKESLQDTIKECRKKTKRKVKLFRQYWKSAK